MKTDIQTSNESVTPNSRELLMLKKFFPQCFSKPDTDENGNIVKEHFDIEKLTELLNKDEVDIKKEGFTLNFLGKSYAHYQSNLDSETVIVPDEKNAESDSENVYIVGDNLDALQHLKYSYAEKIKCIYIDPPYNTGKDDFVYNDKFGFTAKELVEKLDVSEEEAERICGMSGKCTHSAWLTFMYPRLALARELLREDGVIFISIDDNEQANLKQLCDEVFGEGNFVGNVIWKHTQQSKNDEKHFSRQYNHIVVFAKSKDKLSNFLFERSEANNKNYSNPDNDPKGAWRSGDVRSPNPRPSLCYDIIAPNGNIIHAPDYGWRWSEESVKEKISTGEIKFKSDNSGIIRKIYLCDQEGRIPENLWDGEEFGSTRTAASMIKDLFNRKQVFDTPKPIELVKKILELITDRDSVGISNPCESQAELASRHFATQKSPGGVAGVSPAEGVAEHRKVCSAGESSPDIILDFFSGSGTTAHAVMDLNASDKGKRKFIMVQLDEPVKKGSEAEKAGYKTIDEIGRERIRRAAAKIKAEHPDTSANLGFKTYYLKSMPKETLDKIKSFDPNALISSDGDIVKSLGEKTLLQTWQIKDGFGFNAVPQKINLSGYTAYLLDDEKIGKYLYLLGEIEEKSIKELIRKIESLELTVDKIFIYGYSFDFNMLNCITTNLKTLKNRNPLEPIVRY